MAKIFNKQISTKRLLAGFGLSIILAIIFLIACIPLLTTGENLPLDEMVENGQANMNRVVVLFGVMVGLYSFISFRLNFYKYSVLFLALYWILGTSFVTFINLSAADKVVANDNEFNTTLCVEQDTIDYARQSTILVANLNDKGEVLSYGSGLALKDSATSGLIITNYHVIENSQNLHAWIGRDGIEWKKLEVFAAYPDSDIAVLKSDYEFPYTMDLIDSDKLNNAETLHAIGWPNSPSGEAVTTRGIFSRRVSESGIEMLQTDASINPGNSGGPLINKCGVVGINTAKITWSNELTPSEGIGFALSSNYINSIIRSQ